MARAPYFQQFFEDVGDGSAFETVLRGHLWIEGELNRSLEAALPFPQHVELESLRFNQKVGLVAAHGLMRPDERPGFKRINTIRNRMAHQLGTDLSETDERDLINALGERHRDHIAMLRENGLPITFPHRLKYAITAMCIQLQIDRQKLENANERLREAAQRLLAARAEDDQTPPPSPEPS